MRPQTGSERTCRKIAAHTGKKGMRAQLATSVRSSVRDFAQKKIRFGRFGTGRHLILYLGLVVLSMLAADAFILWQLQKIRAETLRLTGIQEKLIAIYDVHTSISALHDRLRELADSEDTARVLQEAGPLGFAVRDQVQRSKNSLMQLTPGVSQDLTIIPTLDDIQITLQAQLEQIRVLAIAQDWIAIRRRLDTQIRPLEFMTSDLVAKVDHEVGMEEAQSIDHTRAAELRAFYETTWFLLLSAAAFLVLLWMTYQWRIWQMQHQFEVTLEARVSERTRIARELHDTLLQSFHGVLLRLGVVSQLLRERPLEAQESLDSAMELASNAITEGRDAIQGLRDPTVQSNDLARVINALGEDIAAAPANHGSPIFRVTVQGEPRELHPILRDEVYRIATEALRNAFSHARARNIEVEIRYDDGQVRLRVRDDGKGIDPAVLSRQGREGHYGLTGMRERAAVVGGKLTVWSELDTGTEVELTVPAAAGVPGSLLSSQ
jgi:signal transduction histidine kinase